MNTILLAILNSMWQAAALVGAVWVLLRLARGTNAATRHALWWATLAVVVALPMIPPAGAPAPVPAVDETPIAEVAAPPVAPSVELPSPEPDAPVTLPSGNWPMAVFGAWALACLVQLGRTAWSYRYLRSLKRDARPANPDLRRNFDAWMLSCKVRRPVRLLVSDHITSPVAVGFRQPAVILPAALLETFDGPELDHILLHELAHMARRDDWTNLAARVGSALLAFHPAALFVVRRIDREREMSCDDWVVAMTGEARPYASSLTRLFEVCRGRNRMMLASGMASRPSQLGERIEMLLRRGRVFAAKASLPKIAFSALALLLAGVAFSQAPRWLAFAPDSVTAAAEPDAAPAPPDAEEPQEEAAPAPAPQPPDSEPQTPAPQTRATAPSAPPPGGFLAALVAAGYGNLSVDEIVELKNAGVSGQFLTEMAAAGWGHPPVRELIELAQQGVHPGYAHAMRLAGLTGLTLREVIELHQHGVRPDVVGGVHALGYGPYTARDWVELANHGVGVELFRAFQEAGWKGLGVRDIVAAQNAGVNARSLQEARQYGQSLTLQQIIKLKNAGVI